MAPIGTLCTQEHVSTCAAQEGKCLEHFETWQQQNPSLSQSSAGLSVPWPLHCPCSARAGWESGLEQPLFCSTMSREENWGHRNNWSCAGAQPQHHVVIETFQAGVLFAVLGSKGVHSLMCLIFLVSINGGESNCSGSLGTLTAKRILSQEDICCPSSLLEYFKVLK